MAKLQGGGGQDSESLNLCMRIVAAHFALGVKEESLELGGEMKKGELEEWPGSRVEGGRGGHGVL